MDAARGEPLDVCSLPAGGRQRTGGSDVTTTQRPRATQSTREVYRTDRGQRDKDGKPLRVHVGTETVRTAQCQTHPKQGPSSQFVGVNVNGWIFRCPGGGYRPPVHSGPGAVTRSKGAT